MSYSCEVDYSDSVFQLRSIQRIDGGRFAAIKRRWRCDDQHCSTRHAEPTATSNLKVSKVTVHYTALWW